MHLRAITGVPTFMLLVVVPLVVGRNYADSIDCISNSKCVGGGGCVDCGEYVGGGECVGR